MPKIIFFKKELQICDSKFRFFGTSSGGFSKSFFYFLSSAKYGDQHFYSAAPTVKKLPTTLHWEMFSAFL